MVGDHNRTEIIEDLLEECNINMHLVVELMALEAILKLWN
jgi:hypothetical protein